MAIAPPSTFRTKDPATLEDLQRIRRYLEQVGPGASSGPGGGWGTPVVAAGPITQAVSGQLLLIDATAAAQTVNLPKTVDVGGRVFVKLASPIGMGLTIAGNGTMIDGRPTLPFSLAYEWADLLWGGVSWHQIG